MIESNHIQPISPESITRETNQDKDLKKILKWIKHEWPAKSDTNVTESSAMSYPSTRALSYEGPEYLSQGDYNRQC